RPLQNSKPQTVRRRRIRNRAQVGAEAEVAGRLLVGAILVPRHVERRPETKLPPHHGAASQAAQVEIGIAGRRGWRIVASSRGDERSKIVISAGCNEWLEKKLERQPRRDRPVGARVQLERMLL